MIKNFKKNLEKNLTLKLSLWLTHLAEEKLIKDIHVGDLISTMILIKIKLTLTEIGKQLGKNHHPKILA